jgi:hypothetical protein
LVGTAAQLGACDLEFLLGALAHHLMAPRATYDKRKHVARTGRFVQTRLTRRIARREDQTIRVAAHQTSDPAFGHMAREGHRMRPFIDRQRCPDQRAFGVLGGRDHKREDGAAPTCARRDLSA